MRAFNCPLCNGLFQVDPSSAGQRVACPHCHRNVSVPADDALAPPREIEPFHPSEASKEEMHGGNVVSRQPLAFPAPPTIELQPEADSSFDIPREGEALSSELVPVLPTDELSPSQASTKDNFLQFECPQCANTFRVAKAMVGQEVVCPFCQRRTQIPVESETGSRHVAQPEPGRHEPVENADASQSAELSSPAESPSSWEPAFAGTDTPLIRDEGVKRIVRGEKVVEIRRLSPEEKARRRFRKNLIMVVAGGVVLAVALIYFAKHGL